MALQVVVTTPCSRCAINEHLDVATTVAMIVRGTKCIRPCILIAVAYLTCVMLGCSVYLWCPCVL